MKGQPITEKEPEVPPGIFTADIFTVSEPVAVRHFALAEPPLPCRLLVLIHDAAHQTCSPADLELLNKIADWKELKLQRSEVTVVNLAHQKTTLLQLNKNFHASNIIGFGVAPAEIGFHIDFNVTTLFQFRKVNFIFTGSLKELTADEKLKGRFFRDALRPMFQ